jgi:hypothetical protein
MFFSSISEDIDKHLRTLGKDRIIQRENLLKPFHLEDREDITDTISYLQEALNINNYTSDYNFYAGVSHIDKLVIIGVLYEEALNTIALQERIAALIKDLHCKYDLDFPLSYAIRESGGLLNRYFLMASVFIAEHIKDIDFKYSGSMNNLNFALEERKHDNGLTESIINHYNKIGSTNDRFSSI